MKNVRQNLRPRAQRRAARDAAHKVHVCLAEEDKDPVAADLAELVFNAEDRCNKLDGINRSLRRDLSKCLKQKAALSAKHNAMKLALACQKETAATLRRSLKQYQRAANGSPAAAKVQCRVCYEERDVLTVYAPCGHIICPDCDDKWLSAGPKPQQCFYCRQDVAGRRSLL